MEKTNVMRLLDAASISYKIHCYDKNVTDGVSVAHLCEENEDQVFKTLVTIGNDKNHYVFCIPVNSTLDLKKGAKVIGIKNIEMIITIITSNLEKIRDNYVIIIVGKMLKKIISLVLNSVHIFYFLENFQLRQIFRNSVIILVNAERYLQILLKT